MQIVFTETNSCRNRVKELFEIKLSDSMPLVPRVGEKIALGEFIPEDMSDEIKKEMEHLSICQVYDVCYMKGKILINVWEC